MGEPSFRRRAPLSLPRLLLQQEVEALYQLGTLSARRADAGVDPMMVEHFRWCRTEQCLERSNRCVGIEPKIPIFVRENQGHAMVQEYNIGRSRGRDNRATHQWQCGRRSGIAP